jgi:hypothetical protein
MLENGNNCIKCDCKIEACHVYARVCRRYCQIKLVLEIFKIERSCHCQDHPVKSDMSRKTYNEININRLLSHNN